MPALRDYCVEVRAGTQVLLRRVPTTVDSLRDVCLVEISLVEISLVGISLVGISSGNWVPARHEYHQAWVLGEVDEDLDLWYALWAGNLKTELSVSVSVSVLSESSC
jgi:hypothetical protein